MHSEYWQVFAECLTELQLVKVQTCGDVFTYSGELIRIPLVLKAGEGGVGRGRERKGGGEKEKRF